MNGKHISCKHICCLADEGGGALLRRKLKKIGTQEINTKRLLLRRFQLSDAHAMYENWCSDPDVTKYMRFTTHKNEEETAGILGEWTESYKEPTYYHWGIVLKETNEIIGSIGVMSINENDRNGEFGYCMGRAWWGKGFMTEAAGAVLSYMFEKVQMNRIEASHSVNNPASGGVMKKIGMTCFGTAHQRYICSLGPQDTREYEIVFEDWKKANK